MEHKFRAWDNETQEFVYSDQDNDDAWFEFKDGTLKAFALHGMDAGSIDEPPQPICDELESVEMFTGLHDKNGKEIFEGDIVKSIVGEIGVVEWICWDAFCGYDINPLPQEEYSYGFIRTNGKFNQVEVIGHVHADRPEEMTK